MVIWSYLRNGRPGGGSSFRNCGRGIFKEEGSINILFIIMISNIKNSFIYFKKLFMLLMKLLPCMRCQLLIWQR